MFWTCCEDYTLIMFCNPYIRRLSRKFLCLLSILALRWSRKSLKLLSLYFGGFSSSTSSLAQVTFSCSAKPWVLAIEILASSRFRRARCTTVFILPLLRTSMWSPMWTCKACGSKVHNFGRNFVKYPKFWFYRWGSKKYLSPILIF